MNILVVEDDPYIGDLYRTMLPSDGHQVMVVMSGEEVFPLPRNRFDLVFLDYHLPNENGLVILSKLKEQGWQQPFCMVTIEMDHDIASEAFAKGAAGYIVKPFDHDELRRKIDELCP